MGAVYITGDNTVISRMLAPKRSSTKRVILLLKKYSSGVGYSKISMDGRSLSRAKKVQKQYV
jgi:hypothetical protein